MVEKNRVNILEIRKTKKKYGRFFLLTGVICWFVVLVLLPVFGLVQEAVRSGTAVFIKSILSPEFLRAFNLTLIITAGCVIFHTLFGIILALVLVKRNFKCKLLLEGIIDLPFAVSPVVAGFMFLILFGPNGWIGNWFEARHMKIVYAVPGMLIATLFVTFPFVVREVTPVLREFGIQQEEAAYVLGASKWQTFWKVTLPSIKWGMIYGVTLTVARAIGEFGAVLVVSGSIIGKTHTVTLHIHQEFTDFHYAGAYAAAIVLAFMSFTILTTMQFIGRMKGR